MFHHRRLVALASLPLLAALCAPARAWGERIVGSGQSATETRAVAGFDGVRSAGGMDLIVRQAAAESVQVQADDNLLPYLETTVEGGKLVVRWKQGISVSPRNQVLVTVGAVKLRELSSAGSGDMTIEPFHTPELKVALSGSGDLKFAGLATEDLGLRISGSGDIRGDGRATKLSIAIAGSGDASLAGLQADEVSVRIAGSGDAFVNAQKKLDISIAGSGDVAYTGNASVSSSIAGSGTVKRR